MQKKLEKSGKSQGNSSVQKSGNHAKDTTYIQLIYNDKQAHSGAKPWLCKQGPNTELMRKC